jgi:hypothetical protein
VGILDVQTEKEVVRIVNIYKQKVKGREGWCLNRWPVRIGAGMELIVIGDFNAKSGIWDEDSEPIREEMMVNIVEREELILLNEYNRKTWKRNAKEAVLDLA